MYCRKKCGQVIESVNVLRKHMLKVLITRYFGFVASVKVVLHKSIIFVLQRWII